MSLPTANSYLKKIIFKPSVVMNSSIDKLFFPIVLYKLEF